MLDSKFEQRYKIAVEQFAELEVDVARALGHLKQVAISLHCWQGDDVRGFEGLGMEIGGGLAVTGNYPGQARTPEELQQDLAQAYSLIPGRHRLNLHASYGEFGGRRIDRHEIGVEHFQGWIGWARANGLGLDFNPTFFAHRHAADGFTLSHANKSIREFWIEHGRCCRRIGAAMGQELGSPCVTNVWIPDGMKDTPVDRLGPRERLLESLDRMFAEPLDCWHNLDAVECKLFGLGSESYVVGSHEFYMGYAVSRQKVLCLDSGHFHPTETIADKISAVMQYVPRLLLHVSRGIRWDSDHVVTLGDELQLIANELVRGEYLSRTHVGLDYFDASINRIAAWVIGSRNVLKALMIAMLVPTEKIGGAERQGDYTSRLALQEDVKLLPFGAIWDYYCLSNAVPPGLQWMDDIRGYEKQVLSKRSL